MGINYIDTARSYGESEVLLGKALKGHRDKVIVCTKCGILVSNDPYYELGADHFGTELRRNLSAASIRTEIETSLRRMDVDYIDILMTHWPDPNTPVEETVDTLNTLKKEGKIRAIACANVTSVEMDIYRASDACCLTSNCYSMLKRDLEKTFFPYCAEHGVAFAAYGALASGMLTGMYGPEYIFGNDDHRKNDILCTSEKRKCIQEFLQAIRPMVKDYGLTFAQLAYAWVLSQPGCTHVLSGAVNIKQVKENAAVGMVTLSETDLAYIKSALDVYWTGVA